MNSVVVPWMFEPTSQLPARKLFQNRNIFAKKQVQKTPPFLCRRRDQTDTLMKEMFYNVPDNAAAGVFGNENSREATVTEAGRIVFSHLGVS